MNTDTKYTVWVGGGEITEYYVDRYTAEVIVDPLTMIERINQTATPTNICDYATRSTAFTTNKCLPKICCYYGFTGEPKWT
jgi:hypothetical protein